MARSYRVAKYGGPTGADRLSAGRGGRGSLKIPTGTPRLRVDMNWEEAQEKTAHQARVKALAAAGYDPKILANMSPEVTARLHAGMADDPIEAEQAKAAKEIESKGADALSDLLGLGLNFNKIDQEAKAPTPPETQLEAAPPITDALVGPPSNIRDQSQTMADFMKGREDHVAGLTREDPFALKIPTQEQIEADAETELAGIQSDPISPFFEGEEDPTQPPLTRARELIGMFSELDAVNQERLFPEFLAAMTKFTEPLKEVDEWKKSWFAFETSDDGKTQWRITYNKEGTKELAKTKMPPNVEWKGVRIYKDGKPGYMHVDKNNPFNWHENKDGRVWMGLPKGAEFRAPSRATRKNNPKFTAWLLNHPLHKKLLPFGEGEKGYTVGFNDWLVGADMEKRKAAMEFSKTSSGLEMLINLAIQNAGGVKEGANEFEQEEQRRKNLPGGLGE